MLFFFFTLFARSFPSNWEPGTAVSILEGPHNPDEIVDSNVCTLDYGVTLVLSGPAWVGIDGQSKNWRDYW